MLVGEFQVDSQTHAQPCWRAIEKGFRKARWVVLAQMVVAERT